MLTKNTQLDRFEVLANGCIQVRMVTKIIDGTDVVSSSYHRHCIVPGQDYGHETELVQQVCAAVHTPECVARYMNLQAGQQ